jgi:putative polymerase
MIRRRPFLGVKARPAFVRGSSNPVKTMAPVAPPGRTDAGLLPVVLVLLGVLFNAALAIVNGQFMRLSMGTVIAAELLIVAAAHVTILRNYRQQMLPWYGMMVVAVLFSLVRSIVVGHFEPKFLRDVLLIPTFLMLGMTTSMGRLTVPIVVLHVVVVAGVLFEAFFTQAYSNLFEVRAYYVATRSFDDSDFWNRTSDLFISATRPAERFFSFVDFHRISSVFLEPVSLGNYVVIITAFLCANFRHMSPRIRAFLMLGNLIALIGCDGRLAVICSAICIVVAMVAPRLPRGSALLYLPFGLLMAFIVVNLAHADPLADNFLGRLAHCVTLLGRYDVLDWLGLSDRYLIPAADSGIAYMIATQSFIGVLLFWFLLVMSAEERRPEQARFLHALCLYIVLTMLVSYSLFSIKTAALLWFIHGSLQMASTVRSPKTGPRRPGSPRTSHNRNTGDGVPAMPSATTDARVQNIAWQRQAGLLEARRRST